MNLVILIILLVVGCGAEMPPYERGKSMALQGIARDFGDAGEKAILNANISPVERLPLLCKETRGACYVEPHHLLFVEKGKDEFFYCVTIYHELVHAVSFYRNGVVDDSHSMMGDSYYKEATLYCLNAYLGGEA